MVSTKRIKKIQTALTFVLTGVIIAVFCLWYKIGNDMRWADNFIYDLHFKWRGPVETTGKVALVMMDQKSAVELKRLRGNWSRRDLAVALDNLCEAGAEIIGLDMVLQSPDPDPEADAVLASAIERCGNVVLAWGSTTHGGELLPIDIFRDAAISDGIIDFHEDSDDILRRIRFLTVKPLEDGGIEFFPAFSLELARMFLNIEFTFDFSREDGLLMGEGDKQTLLPKGDLLINYTGDCAAYVNLAYADVVMKRFDPEQVKGKIVIIGSSMATSKDFFGTPFTRFKKPGEDIREKFGEVIKDLIRKDPGVACHAHAVDSILRGRFIKRMPERYILAGTVIVGILGLLFYVARIGIFLETLILVTGTGALILVSHHLFIEKMLWTDIAPLTGVFILQFVCGITLQKVMIKKRTALVTDMFGKYVSRSVVDQLIEGGETGESRSGEVTIFFTDLRGFTTVSEQLGPKNTGLLLNKYFNAMIPIVFDNQGTLDKLMGDAIMAFFGAPLEVPDHPAKAAETALAMLDALENLRKEGNVPGMKNLRAGIGLNTGTVTIGNMGSDRFMDYTIIGDAVNLASRLEGLTKIYGADILVSEFTASKLDDRFLVRELDIVRVKGRYDAVALFELMGYREKADERLLEIIDTFGKGLSAYREKDWDIAYRRFKKVLKLNEKDEPAKRYVERIKRLRLANLDETWDGITTFDRKG